MKRDFSLNLISKYRSALMGFAILWIMFFHAELQTDSPIAKFVLEIGYGGVDIFLFLSGFGLYYSCSHKWNGPKPYYKRRFKRILPTFWIVLLLIFLIQGPYSLKGLAVLGAKCTTLGLWLPFIPMDLWYISLICLLYAIYPIFYKYYTSNPKTTIVGVMSLLFILISIYVLKNIGSDHNGLLILALSRFPIFFIGSFFGRYIESTQNNEGGIFVIATMIGFVMLWLLRANYQEYLWNGALAFIPFILIVPGLCYAISVILNFYPIIAKPFAFIGIYTLEIYVLNEFLLARCYPLIASLFSENIGKVTILLLNIILAIILSKFVSLLTLITKKVYETRREYTK